MGESVCGERTYISPYALVERYMGNAEENARKRYGRTATVTAKASYAAGYAPTGKAQQGVPRRNARRTRSGRAARGVLG